MRYVRTLSILFAVLVIGIVAGCGAYEEGGAAEGAVQSAAEAAGEATQGLTEAASDAVEEATGMSPEDLQKRIDEYKQLIADKEGELGEVAEKLKGMSPADLLGDDAKALKSKSDSLTQEIADIKEKLATATGMLDG